MTVVAAILLLLAGVEWDHDVRIIHPYTVESRSGTWRLECEPGDRFGMGPSTLRVIHAETTVHERTIPFTFQIAAITDEGYAVGLGRTDWKHARGDYVFGVTDPRGTLLREERYERTSSRFFHQPSDPNFRYLFVDPGGEWAVLHVDDPDINRRRCSWWRYPIRTDGDREVLRPTDALGAHEDHRLSLIEATMVPGTGRILTHWWTLDYGPDRTSSSATRGALYALMDDEATVRWELSLYDDYESPTSWATTSSTLRNGGILEVTDDRRFALFHAADGERVDYRIEYDGQVTDTGRRPFAWTRRSRPERPPTRRLTATAEVPLLPDAQPHPIRDVVDLGFDVSSDPIAIRRDGPGRYTSVLISREDDRAREVAWEPLHEPLASGSVKRHEVGRGEWLVSARAWEDDDGAAWFLVDATTGAMTRLGGADGPPMRGPASDINGAARASDGWIVLITNALIAVDVDGRPRWRVVEEYGNPKKLFDPGAVATLADGTIAVLETAPKQVKLFSPSGDWLRTVDLKGALGHEPRYRFNMHAHPDGGFVVIDSNGEPPVWHLSTDGTVIASWTPRTEKGNPSQVLAANAKPGPDGRIWSHERSAVHVLGDDGAVVRTFGATPREDRPVQPRGARIDALGRTWLYDERAKVHFPFDADGRPIDAARGATDGHHPSRRAEAPRLDGEQPWLELSGERYLFASESQPIRVTDREGRILAAHEKLSDGAWTGEPIAAAMSADGRAALLQLRQLVLLDDDGRPVREIAALARPFSPALSIGGDHVLISNTGPHAVLYSFEADRWETLRVADDDDHGEWWWGLAPDGAAALVVDGETYTLRRYPLR